MYYAFGQGKSLEEIAWFMSFSSTAAAHVLSFFLRQNVSFARKRKFFAHSALLFSLVLLSYFHLVRSFFSTTVV